MRGEWGRATLRRVAVVTQGGSEDSQRPPGTDGGLQRTHRGRQGVPETDRGLQGTHRGRQGAPEASQFPSEGCLLLANKAEVAEK